MLEAPIECAPAQAERLRCVTHIPFVAVEGLLNQDLLDFLEGKIFETVRRSPRPRGGRDRWS